MAWRELLHSASTDDARDEIDIISDRTVSGPTYADTPSERRLAPREALGPTLKYPRRLPGAVPPIGTWAEPYKERANLNAAELVVNVAEAESDTVIKVEGEIDIATSPFFRNRMDTAASPGGHGRVDLSGVTFMDVSALRALLACRQEARRLGGDLVVVTPTRIAARVLSLCGCDDLLVGDSQPR